MIIHAPEIKKLKQEVEISSVVEFQQKIDGCPERLWYIFPENYGQYIRDSSNPFITGLILLAMYLGEDVQVGGGVSPRLAESLEDFQQIFHTWFPKLLSQVDIRFDHLETPARENPTGNVATAFSGGVDSLYTIWLHLPQNRLVPPARITHVLFIQGYDWPLTNLRGYQNIMETHKQALAPLDITLIPCRTNGYHFWNYQMRWDYVFGGMLIGAALCLDNFLDRFYVPATHTYAAPAAQGSTPLTDHLLSTEGLEIWHSGASKNRVEKLEIISDWKLAHDNLHICVNNKQMTGVENCSRCDKCLRTMIMLEVMGKLKHFNTFKHTLHYGDILRWALGAKTAMYPRQIYRKAVTERKFIIAAMMIIGRMRGSIRRKIVVTLMNRLPKNRITQVKRWRYGSSSKE